MNFKLKKAMSPGATPSSEKTRHVFLFRRKARKPSETESLFLTKLPIEIRLIIYRHYLLDQYASNQVIHVRSQSSQEGVTVLKSYRCLLNDEHAFVKWEEGDMRRCFGHTECQEAYLSRHPRSGYAYRPDRRVLLSQTHQGLMLTCSQIKSEIELATFPTLSVVLEENFLAPLGMFFRRTDKTILNSVRSLKLHMPLPYPFYYTRRNVIDSIGMSAPKGEYAETMQQELDTLWLLIRETAPNLQSLHVKFFDRGFRLREETLLKPLKYLQIPDFTIQLPWPRDYEPTLALPSDEGHSFRIIRPEGDTSSLQSRGPIRLGIFHRCHRQRSLGSVVTGLILLPIWLPWLVGHHILENIDEMRYNKSRRKAERDDRVFGGDKRKRW